MAKGRAPGVAARSARAAEPSRSFDAAFDTLLARAHGLAFAMIGDAVLAEEIAVDALARLAVDFRRLRRHGQVATALAQLVTRRAIDAVAAREPVASLGGPPPDPHESRLLHDEARALRALPRRRREVVAMWCFGGCEPADIAERLRMTPAAVETELATARAALRAALGSDLVPT